MERKGCMKKSGFSLIELLVAIAIMAVIMAVTLPNYIGARERARDTKLKGELNQLKSALRMYYNDYQGYPSIGISGSWPFNGCGPNGTTLCNTISYVCTNFWFAAGGSGCGTVYMKKPPTITTGGFHYYRPDSDKFVLCVDYLENRADPDALASRTQCEGYGGTTGYCVCSD